MRGVPGSKLRRDTAYLEDVRGLHQFLQANAEIVHKLSHGHYIPLFPTPFSNSSTVQTQYRLLYYV
jgi:hypothetical protein